MAYNLKHSRPVAMILVAVLSLLQFRIDFAGAQNIVTEVDQFSPANPAKLTDKDVSEFFEKCPKFGSAPNTSEAQRCLQKLESHIIQFLAGTPFQPFHHTLGISGYEVYFGHSDEMFYSLAIAFPFLGDATSLSVKTYLNDQLLRAPPYQISGVDNRAGNPRESYHVPAALRQTGRSDASSAFGVYAFWAWCYYSQNESLVHHHWKRILDRMQPLLDADYPFNARSQNPTGDTEKLNGDLAGLMGLIRLANLMKDKAIAQQANERARQLLELRVNFERLNASLVEKSRQATKSLHNYKLGRYCDLVPEVGLALAQLTEGRGGVQLKTFREARHGWYLAFGDRLIGGENYTNPLHFPRSLFAGAALVEQLSGEPLYQCLDVPWCRGDFYFIEKCALALWAGGGRPWESPL